jgi:DNA-binding transcriptional ArsR family regulator
MATTPKSKMQNLKSNDPLSEALDWDSGTAYELLLSLDTITRPKAHGVPAPWAAGVRKRLSPRSQADFKAFFGPPFGIISYTPIHLVLEMSEPKDVAHFFDYVQAIPDDDFSRRVHLPLVGEYKEVRDVTQIIASALNGERISAPDIEEYRRAVGRSRILPPPSAVEVRALFADMAEPAATKKRWLSVLKEYHTVFFAEEEVRLAPVLKQMLEDARALSNDTTVPDLIERLSNGFTISEESDVQRLVLVPSVWCHPFVVRVNLSEREFLMAWGARPHGYRLAPGESVPDQALMVLRALGDPTRLRLLRLLASEPRSPQALAHELKLSLPTVSHHMRELRLAGLVRLEMGLIEKGRDTRYTVRWQSAERAFGDLGRFVMVDGGEDG